MFYQNSNKIDILSIGCFCGLLWAVIKLLIAIYEQSLYLFASALFSICLVCAKTLCLWSSLQNNAMQKAIVHKLSCALLMLGGLFYGLYNVRLLHGESVANYGLIPSIAIAAVSFYLIVNAIVQLAKVRKKDRLHRDIRVITFISACMNIVLTQMCLLAVELPDLDQIYNVYLALGIATLTVLLGGYCFFKSIQ